MMQFREPKNSDRFEWTKHIQMKMRQYGISESRVKRVVRAPQRVEHGVADGTAAAMQPLSTRRDPATGRKVWTQEIWVMYCAKSKVKSQKSKDELHEAGSGAMQRVTAMLAPPKMRLISVWRYPGVSKERDGIPPEIWDEMVALGAADDDNDVVQWEA